MGGRARAMAYATQLGLNASHIVMFEFGQNQALGAVLRRVKDAAGDRSSPELEPLKEDE
jgi:hypothetical protein